MELLLLKSYMYPLIFESNIRNGLTFSSSLQPIKYCKAFYQKRPY